MKGFRVMCSDCFRLSPNAELKTRAFSRLTSTNLSPLGGCVLMLLLCIVFAESLCTASTTQPIYRRRTPSPQKIGDFSSDRLDLTNAHLPRYPAPDANGILPDSRAAANQLFD